MSKTGYIMNETVTLLQGRPDWALDMAIKTPLIWLWRERVNWRSCVIIDRFWVVCGMVKHFTYVGVVGRKVSNSIQASRASLILVSYPRICRKTCWFLPKYLMIPLSGRFSNLSIPDSGIISIPEAKKQSFSSQYGRGFGSQAYIPHENQIFCSHSEATTLF